MAVRNIGARVVFKWLITDWRYGFVSLPHCFNSTTNFQWLINYTACYGYVKLRIMELKQVKTITDIKQGDTLIVTGDTLKNEPVKAQIVKVTQNDGTEIIFDKKMNRFFNLGMYLEGKSWVKDVRVVI